MKKTIPLALCAALIVLCLSGCVSVNFQGFNSVSGRGKAESYELDAGEFTGIRLDIFCDINYYYAPSASATLEVQPNLREYIVAEERNGVLIIRSTKSISWSGKAPVLTISAPTLDSLSLYGAGNFTAHDKITSDSFTLNLAGAGGGTAELDVKNLSVDISGAGGFKLSGRADTASLSLAGAGSLNALGLQTRDTEIDLAGVGTVSISCSDNLRVNGAGMGSIEYKGSPSVDLDRGGIVTVKKVD